MEGLEKGWNPNSLESGNPTELQSRPTIFVFEHLTKTSAEFNHCIQSQAHSFQQQLQTQIAEIGSQINHMSLALQGVQSQIHTSQERNNEQLLSKIEALFSPSQPNQVTIESPSLLRTNFP